MEKQHYKTFFSCSNEVNKALEMSKGMGHAGLRGGSHRTDNAEAQEAWTCGERGWRCHSRSTPDSLSEAGPAFLRRRRLGEK